MTDRTVVARILTENRYCVLATVDAGGRPWATPVFFAPLGDDRLCWVSGPDARHSRTLAARPSVAVTVFDSTVEVGHAEAAYAEGSASLVPADEVEAALRALNGRLPAGRRLAPGDVGPQGPMRVYQVRIEHRYVLVRGGDPDHGNTLDMSLEV
jgi:nitroimidazol reductase NimA-like FMN-containing flavoprotein (pyridoxamine 5'-phosphate oxidase superfamily)